LKEKKYKPIVLVVLDGWGQWENKQGNAIAQANLPTFQKLDRYYPKTLLQASGMAVGLPWGVFGNSEVGHQTMGSGQIIYQFLPIITAQIESGEIFQNKVLLDAVAHVKQHNSKLHFLGLVSDGGVHSHIDHLLSLLDFAKEQQLQDVFIHAITDGRDTPPKSARDYIYKLVEKTKSEGVGQIATLSGRYYTMDRNNNWDRIEKSFNAFTQGTGIAETDPLIAIENQYQQGITDEYFKPVNFVDAKKKPIGLIEKNDAIVCFNYRKDRARQITKAFSIKEFNEFQNAKRPKKIKYVCFSEYEKGLPVDIVFPPQEISTRIGYILSEYNLRQLRIAETEKYAHVTYFFNGGMEKPFKGEERIVVLSKKVQSYADAPEMSAQEVTDKLVDSVDNRRFDFILVNYANPDMVGHTGDVEAGIKAVEFVDLCLKRLIKSVLKKGGCLIITADHGNVEEMINLRTGERDTEHSTNPVPCWFVTPQNHRDAPLPQAPVSKIEGMLVDIPPTILELFNILKPGQMVGQSLLEVFKEKEKITIL
jgi:2,3-bisphosphoglycerate-independent phosphoglycerate mutase